MKEHTTGKSTELLSYLTFTGQDKKNTNWLSIIHIIKAPSDRPVILAEYVEFVVMLIYSSKAFLSFISKYLMFSKYLK